MLDHRNGSSENRAGRKGQRKPGRVVKGFRIWSGPLDFTGQAGSRQGLRIRDGQAGSGGRSGSQSFLSGKGSGSGGSQGPKQLNRSFFEAMFQEGVRGAARHMQGPRLSTWRLFLLLGPLTGIRKETGLIRPMRTSPAVRTCITASMHLCVPDTRLCAADQPYLVGLLARLTRFLLGRNM
jgi:hypothetical protein